VTAAIASFLSEMHSPAGEAPLVICDVNTTAFDPEPASQRPSAAIRIGVDRAGRIPPDLGDKFDLLLTTASTPGREWVSLDSAALDRMLDDITRRVAAHPVAAATLCQVLRIGERLPFADALTLESLAYSALLGSAEFRRWRRQTPLRLRPRVARPMLVVTRSDDTLHIRLNRPEVHNAIDAALRDKLVEALRIAAADPGIVRVVLCGEGPSFSSGGDLNEFGTASDAGMAHVIRIVHSVALEAHLLADKLTVLARGACIGAGAEIAAAAGTVVAYPDTIFRLPELDMGLIPGAGGSVTLPTRIGRWRTACMVLSGHSIDTRQAVEWGLADRRAGKGDAC
jgi:enoyl-CoA hydratase/carnithine racemase